MSDLDSAQFPPQLRQERLLGSDAVQDLLLRPRHLFLDTQADTGAFLIFIYKNHNVKDDHLCTTRQTFMRSNSEGEKRGTKEREEADVTVTSPQ